MARSEGLSAPPPRDDVEADEDQKEASKLIAQLVALTGATVSEIARRAGLAPSTLTRIYPRPSVKYTLSARTLSKLRRLLSDVRASPDQDYERPRQPGSATVNEANAPVEPDDGEALGLHVLTPISAATGRATKLSLDLLTGNLVEPIQRIDRPIFSGRNRYFLCYMPDDSMTPRFRLGDCLLIDKVKPPATGGEAMIVFTDGSRAPDSLLCIVQLVERDRGLWRVRQLADDAIATIRREDIAHAYAIVGSFDDTLHR